jgi:hypothetical protein
LRCDAPHRSTVAADSSPGAGHCRNPSRTPDRRVAHTRPVADLSERGVNVPFSLLAPARGQRGRGGRTARA